MGIDAIVAAEQKMLRYLVVLIGFREMGVKFYFQGAITFSLMILKNAMKQRQKLQKKRKGPFNFRHLRNTEAAP